MTTEQEQFNDVDLLSHNKSLAEKLGLIGYYLANTDVYRSRAFKTASVNIANHETAIISGAQAQAQVPGVGKSIAAAIDEYINSYNEETKTGTIQRLVDLERQYQDRKSVMDLFTSIYGIGPITAAKYYDAGFRTLEDLWNKGNLNETQKLGILWRLHINKPIERQEMDIINETLKQIFEPYNIKWDMAGSYRRGEPRSGDIDILIQQDNGIGIDEIRQLLEYYLVDILAAGQTKLMGMFRLSPDYNAHRIDIRLIEPESYATALMYFTGSQAFNILMRKRALELGMSLNEYYLTSGNQAIYVETEEDIFNALKVKYIPPELRLRNIRTLL